MFVAILAWALKIREVFWAKILTLRKIFIKQSIYKVIYLNKFIIYNN
jgi:hypothetical protein